MVFACQKRERQFGGDVDKEVTDILTASTFQDQNEEFSMWFHLAFLQFFRAVGSNLALLPYFCGLGQFDRIIEIGEQTGLLQENFKNFLKMVPLCPRFFSY